MNDAVTMKLYNGASKPPGSFTDTGSVAGFFLDTKTSGHYCFWRNASHQWALDRCNTNPDGAPFNYVDRVCQEVEQGNP